MSAALVTQPQFPLPTIAGNPPPPSGNAPHTFDTTGQIAPHGMKPRVTATLWEDEGSLCFQVEANGVCVARREDNHMINGTKLLNVAGMTRGRRDGILKSEKTRHVVKIGPMHLKGVWIPFDRALDFANKEKITESLYPLFVHNIGALLYHPQNSARQSISGAAIAGAERRRADGNNIQNMQNFQTSQPYDNSRQMYTTSGQQSQYGSQPGMTRYATMPAGGYVKSDMAPPARAGAEQEHNGDAKPHDGYANHSQEHHSDAEAEHEGEYTHTAAPYGTNRNTYGYSSNTASSMQGDHGHISPEMTGSPHKTSGRATPRTTQSYPGYSTPQRAQLPSSNLYSVMSDNRNATNGADMYANHGYPTQQYAGTNGIASNKRVRELDDSEEHAAKRFAKAV
ncbi:hypothetical protein H2203_003946 [Taxawa tesnikishii (nom. ined.)]|nr:hypothetical protein H2203_003946 [Dothideales sp. JES 119]